MAYRVLVVDDDAMVAISVREMIQTAGHEVVGMAQSGEEAIEMTALMRPDIAVVDIRLPGIDGIETTRRLGAVSNVAVIILTAHVDTEFISGAASAGVFAYLTKPITKESLCANLEVAAARSAELAAVRREVSDVRAAMEVRKLSERAKHVLMTRLQLTEAEAFAHLRQKCRNQNKTMRQASEEILAADGTFLCEVAKEPPKKTV